LPWLSGIPIKIENPAGSKRQPEWPALKNSYGYFERTDAFDGDEVDVFIGPEMSEQPEQVFVIDQVDPKTGQPDEHKVILGVSSPEQAREVYLANYEKDWQGIGDIKSYAFDDFKAKLKSGFFKNSTPSRRLFPDQAALKQQMIDQDRIVDRHPKLFPDAKPESAKKKKTREEFQAHVQELRDTRQAGIQALRDANDGNTIGIEAASKDGERFAVVLKDASEPGKFRVQNYDKSSFSGHQVYGTELEALDALWSDGYRTSAQGAMDKLVGTPAWEQGVEIAAQIQTQNEEADATRKEINARLEALTKPTGRDTTIFIPSTGNELKAKVSVVEGSALTISNDQDGKINPAYPDGLQPRDREKGSSMLQIHKMAANLKPELLDDNGQSNGGSPIVGPDGVVESGNGRSLAILRAYQTNKGKAYREHLKENAASYGLTEAEIDAMESPVLVRVRQGDMTMDERAEFARQSNQAGTAPMTPAENAKADASRITDKDMLIYAPSEQGNILAASNQPFLQKFGARLGDLEVGGLSTPDGRWTKQFADRVQAAIFFKAYGSESLLSLVAEEADPDIKNVLNALNQAAPSFARARAVQKDLTGDTNLGELDIITDLVGAIDLLRQAKSKGSSISQEVDQGGLFGGVDPVVGQVASFIESSMRSSRKMGIGFSAMASALESELQSQSQERLFDMEPITKSDLVAAANREIGTEYGESDLFAPQETPTGPVDRIRMAHKDVLKRIPELQAAAKKVKAGEMTAAEYDTLVNKYKPILPYETLPKPATVTAMRDALHKNKTPKLGKGKNIEAGHQVGLRLDIPAYRDHNVWVPTIHENEPGQGKKSIAHEATAVLTNATFPEDTHALKVAAGASKAPSAVIKGSWVQQSQADTIAEAKAAMTSPDWIQVGFDPERHSYFYHRNSTNPVVSAERIIQIGGMVLAKNPVFSTKSKFLFRRGAAPGAPTGTFEDGLREAPKPGETFLVMRIGSGAETLVNVNAGNGVAVAEHIMREEDFEKPSGMRFGETVSLYEVTVEEEFGRYRGHYGRAASAKEPESRVGREPGPAGTVSEWNPSGGTSVGYAFPEGAKYTSKKLISVPYAQIKLELQAREGLADMDDAGSGIGGRFLEAYLLEQVSKGQMVARRGESKKKLSTRRDRAQKAGFDTGTVYYHGTTRDFSEFARPAFMGDRGVADTVRDLAEARYAEIAKEKGGIQEAILMFELKSNGITEAPGGMEILGEVSKGLGTRTVGGEYFGGEVFFFSQSPQIASDYASPLVYGETSGSVVIPVYLKMENPLVIDAKDQAWQPHLDDIRNAPDNGYDSVILNNLTDNFGPEAVRGPNTTVAIFDSSQIRSVHAQFNDLTTGDLLARRGAYSAMAGKEVSYQVVVGETGESYTAKIDADQAMSQYDERIKSLRELRDCI